MAKQYKRKDHLYNLAKIQGVRSRAFYKLEEMDKKHRFLKRGSRVLDLGAWPGGWLEYAASRVGQEGVVIGIDLKKIEDLGLSNVQTVEGDILEEETVDRGLALAGDRFNAVVSDLSPKLSGLREVDQAAGHLLWQGALKVARRCLSRGGVFVLKLFKGQEAEQFVMEMREIFAKVSREELSSSRGSSNEFYLIGFGFKGGL